MAPVSTPQPYSSYPTTLAYLRAVQLMPPIYAAHLLDNEWLDDHIPTALRDAAPQRALNWGSAIPADTPASIATKFTGGNTNPREHGNAIALFTYVAGNRRTGNNACGEARCGRIFTDCVVVPAALRIEALGDTYHFCCASCMFNGQMTLCFLHPDYAGKKKNSTGDKKGSGGDKKGSAGDKKGSGGDKKGSTGAVKA